MEEIKEEEEEEELKAHKWKTIIDQIRSYASSFFFFQVFLVNIYS